MARYKFRDLDTKKIYSVKADHPTNAITNLNKKARKMVNYTFLGKKAMLEISTIFGITSAIILIILWQKGYFP